MACCMNYSFAPAQTATKSSSSSSAFLYGLFRESLVSFDATAIRQHCHPRSEKNLRVVASFLFPGPS